MSKRKTNLGGTIECPADGEEFETGFDLDAHTAEEGPICENCGTHVDPTKWIGIVGHVEAVNEAEKADDEDAEEGDEEEAEGE